MLASGKDVEQKDCADAEGLSHASSEDSIVRQCVVSSVPDRRSALELACSSRASRMEQAMTASEERAMRMG